MSKSVLVMKTPETCLDCMFCHEFDEGKEAYCYVMDGDKDSELKKRIDCEYGYCQGKPDWCPLMDLPEKDNGDYPANTSDAGFAEGWNQCIDEITGGNADD
nr:MAG: hypothetical protein [Bacteriophage sp.]UVY43372.1 MAG: hypothetical protein [Bacteriophage sp.]